MKNLISLLLALIVMYFGAVADRMADFLREQTARDFRVAPRLWLLVGLDVGFIGAILLLAWAVALRLYPNKWVGAVWIIIGAAVLVYMPLLTGGPEWLSTLLSSNLLRLPRTAILTGGIHSHLWDASAAIAIVGGWLLLRRSPQSNS